MADKTGISWTDATWSPVVGCSRVSEGCRNCYSERLVATRLRHTEKYSGLAQMTQAGPRWTNVVRCVEDALLQPLRWSKPRRIFVNSMSDTFHKDVPDDFRDKMFAVMALCPQHTFQVLTKRPERAAEYFAQSDLRDRVGAIAFVNASRLPRFDAEPYRSFSEREWPLPNVWVGTSVEDQTAADARIPHLLNVPAKVRFLSCEPLLGPLVLPLRLGRKPDGVHSGFCQACDCEYGKGRTMWFAGAIAERSLCDRCLDGIHWVIAGGESGPNARPMHPDWARSLRDQCAAAGVPFHFKQNGEWAPGEIVGSLDKWQTWEAAWMDDNGVRYQRRVTPSEDFHADDQPDVYKIGTGKAGRWLDGVGHLAFPEVAGAR